MGFENWLSLNAGQKYCRKLQGEHSAILSTFIKQPFVIKIFVLSIFEWPLKTGFTRAVQIWSSFITFVTYMLRQSGIRLYTGLYVIFKLQPDLKKNTVYLSSYSPLSEGRFSILINSMLRTYRWYRRAYNSSINWWNFLKFLRKYPHILI